MSKFSQPVLNNGDDYFTVPITRDGGNALRAEQGDVACDRTWSRPNSFIMDRKPARYQTSLCPRICAVSAPASSLISRAQAFACPAVPLSVFSPDILGLFGRRFSGHVPRRATRPARIPRHARDDYSYRSASIGSSLAAFTAG